MRRGGSDAVASRKPTKSSSSIAALDRCFRAHVLLEPVPLLAATHSQHTAGRWVYAVSLHASNHDGPLRFRLDLADLGADRPTAPGIAWD